MRTLDTDFLGRPADVPFKLFELLLDEHFLGHVAKFRELLVLADEAAEIFGLRCGRGEIRLDEAPDIVSRDFLSFAQNQEALHHVVELADVASPLVALKQVYGVVGELLRLRSEERRVGKESSARWRREQHTRTE